MKIVFADQLRGVAALLVLVNHFTGVYWGMRDVVARYTFSPPQTGAVPHAVSLVVGVPFNPGPLGVALFFLISGLVIPFSFAHHTRGTFLLARVLRIYPVYLAALAVEFGVRYLSARYWHIPFAIPRRELLANALLIHDFLGIPSIDLVNWTLAIELKFYLLFALAHGAIMRWRAGFVLGASVAAIVFNLAATGHLGGFATRIDPAVRVALANEAMCLPFLLLGTLFFFRLKGMLSLPALAFSLVAGLALFLLCWRIGPISTQFPVITWNYVLALALFTALFAARKWFVEIRALRSLAAISFPLYLVHSMIGYCVLKVMMGLGAAYLPAAACALAAALLAATALHVTIEKASIRWGRQLGRAAVARTEARFA